MIGQEYLRVVGERFKMMKLTAENAISQVSDSGLFWKENDTSNSIANIVNHLNGNMRSRWTDFLTTDGEKENRNRDCEFTQQFSGRQDVLHCWEQGWSVFLNELNSLKDTELLHVITIRNEQHTVIEAIERQMYHYSYHIGQIVFIAKQLVDKEWKTLSIETVRS